MVPDSGPPSLVLIAGPIAAGKSAVSRRLADDLRVSGRQVALVELDALADMARPTLPDWTVAHRIFASVTGQWLRAGLDVVIAESVSNRDELEIVFQSVPAGTPVLTPWRSVVGSRRAGADAGRPDPRGLSRDADFLRGVHEQWAEESPLFPVDLALDTATTPLVESVHRIRSALAAVSPTL